MALGEFHVTLPNGVATTVQLDEDQASALGLRRVDRRKPKARPVENKAKNPPNKKRKE